MPDARPIITFTTDFGTSDAYVGEMKGAVLRLCPDATLVDITHNIPPQSVLSGAIALERAVRAFPPGTIHVVVVDPGVGTDRKLLVAHVLGQRVIAPDNGLITWVWNRVGNISTRELLFRPTRDQSNTFHGRDILAPAAAHLAAGNFDAVPTSRLDRPVLLGIAPARSLAEAVVIHIDHFGNATTNVPAELVTSDTHVLEIGRVRRTYADVEIGEPLALIGSSGLLEIAVRNQNGASQLNLAIGTRIKFRK
jgi:S-adenosyl-L-methionine hydrolase (adenosine-forming)